MGGCLARLAVSITRLDGPFIYESAASSTTDHATRTGLAARQLADRLEDPRLRAWRAMEAEPYMYKGLWDDGVRVAEEDLPHCWAKTAVSALGSRRLHRMAAAVCLMVWFPCLS